MFSFVTKRGFFVNLLVAILVSALLLFLVLESLDFFTQHGKMKTIPDVVGKSYDEAVKVLEAQGFDVEVQDSIYYDSLPRLSVIKQFPIPEATVKINRTVFLTINRAIPPEVDMPQLEGLTFRSAEMVLRSLGLKTGDTTYRPDFARNSVLEQSFNGKRISAGSKIRMGSAIDLVLGQGVTETEMNVPDLFGLTFGEARIILEQSGLSIGAIVPKAEIDLKDTANAFIYKQTPEVFNFEKKPNRIRSGMSIDVYLDNTKPVRDTTNTP